MRAAISSVISALRSTISGCVLALLDLDGRVGQRRGREPTHEPATELLLVGGVLAGDPAPLLRAAVVVTGDDVLGDVDEAPGQVAGVGRPEGGVGEALAGAVGGDEVLEDRHPLAEVAPDGDVDDPARRVGHQAAHRAELADVALVPAGAGRGHHRDRAVRLEALHHLVGQGGRRLLPDVDHLLVALVVGDQAALELAVDLGDLVVGLLELGRACPSGPRCRTGRSSSRRGSRSRTRRS